LTQPPRWARRLRTSQKPPDQGQSTTDQAQPGAFSVLRKTLFCHETNRTPSINSSAGIPFINAITDLVQPPSGADQEYILPTALPYLLGAEAAWIPSTSAPSYKNGVINLDAIHGRTTVGYMYGGIVADKGNFGNTAAGNGIYQVTLSPIPKAKGKLR
jgi:hypothetical protein